MNGDVAVDRCPWEERLFGRPTTIRRTLTFSVLIMLGVSVAYVQIDHASRPRQEQVKDLGAVLSDMAVPEPLLLEAQERGERPVFTDFGAYEEFLLKHGLTEGVLIIRARTIKGDFLYDGFPRLCDRNTFSTLAASFPDLVSERGDETAPLHRIHVFPLPSKQLSTRSAAEDALEAGDFPSLRRKRRDSEDSRSAKESTFPRPSNGERKQRGVPTQDRSGDEAGGT